MSVLQAKHKGDEHWTWKNLVLWELIVFQKRFSTCMCKREGFSSLALSTPTDARCWCCVGSVREEKHEQFPSGHQLHILELISVLTLSTWRQCKFHRSHSHKTGSCHCRCYKSQVMPCTPDSPAIYQGFPCPALFGLINLPEHLTEIRENTLLSAHPFVINNITKDTNEQPHGKDAQSRVWQVGQSLHALSGHSTLQVPPCVQTQKLSRSSGILFLFLFLRQYLTVLSKLVLNPWAQVIFPLQPPKRRDFRHTPPGLSKFRSVEVVLSYRPDPSLTLSLAFSPSQKRG